VLDLFSITPKGHEYRVVTSDFDVATKKASAPIAALRRSAAAERHWALCSVASLVEARAPESAPQPEPAEVC
jgi:hypothetical protein